MVAVRMFIDKFRGVVLIEEDHPLAVAQRAKNAAAKVTRIDGKPLERGPDGLIAGEPLNLTDEERANLPPLSPAAPNEPSVVGSGAPPVIDSSRTDDDLILQFSVEALDRGYSEAAAEGIARGRLAHLRAGGDGYSVIEVPPAVEVVPEGGLLDLPPEKREVRAVQAYLTQLGRKELQDLAKEHGVAANQSSADIVEQLTVKLTTPVPPAPDAGEGPE